MCVCVREGVGGRGKGERGMVAWEKMSEYVGGWVVVVGGGGGVGSGRKGVVCVATLLCVAAMISLSASLSLMNLSQPHFGVYCGRSFCSAMHRLADSMHCSASAGTYMSWKA